MQVCVFCKRSGRQVHDRLQPPACAACALRIARLLLSEQSTGLGPLPPPSPDGAPGARETLAAFQAGLPADLDPVTLLELATAYREMGLSNEARDAAAHAVVTLGEQAITKHAIATLLDGLSDAQLALIHHRLGVS